ncbi:MAG: PEP-CTERM sorting domain-containing protein, partial [Armatimonadetes bacterium]|nr:PEP-CTERM sorting domain-containing protein [Armatimonadota bacterium]
HVMIENLGGGGLNPASITRIRWYGTDWSGTGGDFFDIKNVVFRSGPAAPPIPEPATMSLLLIGALPLAKRLRRR